MLLLEIEFPNETVRERYSTYTLLRREAFSHVHRVLEETAEVSPPEALELSVALPYEDPTRDGGTWTWSFGRISMRASREDDETISAHP
jgi:hypothetical protein